MRFGRMHLPSEYNFRQMTREEATILYDWAASEGWNPGLNDLDIAWRAQPESFVALVKEADLVGGGCIMNYEGAFGFMGLFIMRPDMRSQGLGARLWHWRRDTLLSRLGAGASIAMDGVFGMVPFYQRGGFQSAYKVLRRQGIARGRLSDQVETLSSDDFPEIEAFDRSVSGIKRPTFMSGWIGQEGGHVACIRNNGRITAYGVTRPCRDGFKIGPLFSETTPDAKTLFQDLMARVEGHQVQIDVPEPNEDAQTMVADVGLKVSFGCVRLYHGGPLDLPLTRIFGVTSLEFG